jgi:Mce-associated membrane protein
VSAADETNTAVVDPTSDEKSAQDTTAHDTTARDTTAREISGPLDGPAAAPVQQTVRAGRFPLRLSLPVAAVLGVVLVLALAAAVAFGVLLQQRAATDRAGQQALATAKAYAVTVTTYDYQNLDRNFADVLDGATGEFKDQYNGASQTLRQLISNAKATARGTVLGAGISSESTDQVEVAVFVDQAITNAATAQPRIDRNRVLMTLTPHAGRWLVSKLEIM